MSTTDSHDSTTDDRTRREEIEAEHGDVIDELVDRDDTIGALARAHRTVLEEGQDDE